MPGHRHPGYEVPEETPRVAHATFPRALSPWKEPIGSGISLTPNRWLPS